MAIKDLVKADIQSQDIFLAEFGGAMASIQADIFEEVLKFLDKIPQKNGRIVFDETVNKLILAFEARLYYKLAQSNYSKEIKALLTNFDNLEEIRKELSIAINPADKKKILKANLSAKKLGYTEMITKSLGRKETFGINVINPLRNIIYEHAVLGLSVSDAARRLGEVALSEAPNGGILARYATQVAHDALFGFSGAIDQGIKDITGAQGIAYLGDLVRDSRPQCVRWVTKYNGYIPPEKVDAEIAWAKKYGEGYSRHLPKLSKETFSIVRGGHNCRHRAIWTNGNNLEKINEIHNEFDKQNEQITMKLEEKLGGRAKILYEQNKKLIQEKIDRFKK